MINYLSIDLVDPPRPLPNLRFSSKRSFQGGINWTNRINSIEVSRGANFAIVGGKGRTYETSYVIKIENTDGRYSKYADALKGQTAVLSRGYGWPVSVTRTRSIKRASIQGDLLVIELQSLFDQCKDVAVSDRFTSGLSAGEKKPKVFGSNASSINALVYGPAFLDSASGSPLVYTWICSDSPVTVAGVFVDGFLTIPGVDYTATADGFTTGNDWSDTDVIVSMSSNNDTYAEAFNLLCSAAALPVGQYDPTLTVKLSGTYGGDKDVSTLPFHYIALDDDVQTVLQELADGENLGLYETGSGVLKLCGMSKLSLLPVSREYVGKKRTNSSATGFLADRIQPDVLPGESLYKFADFWRNFAPRSEGRFGVSPDLSRDYLFLQSLDPRFLVAGNIHESYKTKAWENRTYQSTNFIPSIPSINQIEWFNNIVSSFTISVFEQNPSTLEPGMRITANDGFVSVDCMILSIEYDEVNNVVPVKINSIGYLL